MVDTKKVLLPTLHTKLGLMKQVVKALDKDCDCFKYLCKKFPDPSEVRLREEIFVMLQNRKLTLDEQIERKMREVGKRSVTWI